MKETHRYEAVPTEQGERLLALWVYVLHRGVRDFAAAEIKRGTLESLVDSGTDKGLSFKQLVKAFNSRLEQLRELQADVPLSKQRCLTHQRAVKDKVKLLSSTLYDDAVVFMGYDEPTEWFWSDSIEVGSIRWIYGMLRDMPTLDEYRTLVLSDLKRFAESTL